MLRPSWPEKATKTRQYDLLRPRVGQKKPPRLGSTICYGQTCARKSHQDSAIRFVTAKCGPERATKTVRFVTAKSWQERATETRQYDLLRPNVGHKEPPRLGSTICYSQTWARKSQQDSTLRFVTANSPERATKTRQYDLLRPRIVQKEQPRLGSTIRSGKEFGSTICYGQEWARKSHQDSAVRFGTVKHGPERANKTRQYDLLRPERATKTRQYDLLRPIVGQKEPARLGSTICYGQELARKSHRDSAVRFVAAKRVPEKAHKTRQYDLLRPNLGQKEPSRLSRKSRQDSAIRFVTAKSWQERATENRQYDL